MANVMGNIFDKLKTKFSNTSPQNIDQQAKIDEALNAGKKITIKAPKSERYTYLPNLAGKAYEKFRPETREEKDTLSPIGFFRQGEIDEERNKKIAEKIREAAAQLGRKKLTKGQEKLVTAQAQSEQMYTQDVPSTAIKKIKYDPKTESLYVTFQGGHKAYWYPNVTRREVEELMAAPSKGEYFMQNIHDQHSVNYQLHGNHNPQNNVDANKMIRNYYKKMKKDYKAGKKAGTMKGVLNNGRS
jgi:hypothetical protein